MPIPFSPTDRWTAGQEPVDGAGNIYANLVTAFAAVVPPIPAEHLRAATEAGRLLARSIVCADRVLDGDVSAAARAEKLLAAQVCQYEGLRLLHHLIAPDHAFWDAMALRLREFADACLAEATLGTCEVADAERIALGKNALARLTAPVVCALGGRPALVEPLDTAIANLIVAVQALDDAVDWKSDHAAGRISLITARIAAARPEDVARFVFGSAMPAVLGQGRAALAAARAIDVLDASPIWRQLTGRIAAGYDRALALFGTTGTRLEHAGAFEPTSR